MLKPLLIILLSSVLVNNYVLNKFLGICPFLGVSKKVDQATGMGLAVIFVILVSTAATSARPQRSWLSPDHSVHPCYRRIGSVR